MATERYKTHGQSHFNPLNINLTTWSNTLKQLSVLDYFVGLALKGLNGCGCQMLIIIVIAAISISLLCARNYLYETLNIE